MSRTVTIRLKNNIYEMFRKLAEDDNRTLSNFIETSVLRFIDSSEYLDEYEMAEINTNNSLNHSIKRGLQDAKLKKGRFVK